MAELAIDVLTVTLGLLVLALAALDLFRRLGVYEACATRAQSRRWSRTRPTRATAPLDLATALRRMIADIRERFLDDEVPEPVSVDDRWAAPS